MCFIGYMLYAMFPAGHVDAVLQHINNAQVLCGAQSCQVQIIPVYHCKSTAQSLYSAVCCTFCACLQSPFPAAVAAFPDLLLFYANNNNLRYVASLTC